MEAVEQLAAEAGMEVPRALGFGTSMPASAASCSTASMKPRPGFS